jgi:tetratricopeptide (TPR) repeat protein
VVFLSAVNLLPAAAPALPKLRAQLAAAEKAEDDAAVAELSQRILEATPTDSKLWEKRARAELALADFDRCQAALDRWERAVKPRPAVIDDLRGDLAFAQKGFKEAEPRWRAFLASKPSPADAVNTYAKLANLCVEQGRWRENLECWVRIVALKDNAANRVARATSYLRLHRWDEAYADINKANALDPSDESVKQWLPQFERLQQFLPQLKELDVQIAKSPNDIVPLLDQARLFTLADRPLLAFENSEKALKLQPGSMRARIQTAEALLDNDRSDDAATLQVSGNLKRAENKHVADQPLRELAANDALLLENPKNLDALIARAKVLHSLKQFTLALADARGALALNDQSAEAHLTAAQALDELGEKKHALAEARKATELDPNDSLKWFFRGVLEKERADFPAAIESLNRSLRIRESTLALGEREECERRSGKEKEADADLRRLRELAQSQPQQ